MAELESEDSSDGTLVIDEPNYDNQTIEILDNSDSDVEIVELDDDIVDNSDVEIVELDNDIEENSDVEIVELNNHINNTTSTSLNPSGLSTKVSLTCKLCSRIFTTNNDLLNHIRKFKGRIGGCTNKPNNTIEKRKTAETLESEHSVVKKKRGRPPKKNDVVPPQFSVNVLKPVPKTIPLRRPSIPELLPIMFKSVPRPTIATNNILPSLRQILVDEIEPEYPCTMCSETFRHNIGLICHLNSEHNNETTNKEDPNKEKKSQTKLGVKRQIVKKNLVNEIKQIENYEHISNTIDLTLLPDFKKDSLMNRMKSYVYSPNKDQAICLLCNIDFKNTKKALAHVEDKHIMDKIECGYCNMKFVYELKLRSHMAKRHKIIGVYKCDKCSKMINKEECDSHSEECKGKVNPIIIKREADKSNSL
ncbi:uncharacterized protein LOC111032642 [Myzus persicae]|uniref:uncharacterized protein LOC111032642 n=1 Tax=Myzus persicae TaxID=13164 RepID=UPI000B937784|nr:uncharacterized protein LOC111032642 [Myzus persicae]XP_022168736.1 uncharacterized protein LOC111032642 [Myzus persicae]XP_022168737.1 uncharacterized protein LOC111032642 [Myzus persicae]